MMKTAQEREIAVQTLVPGERATFPQDLPAMDERCESRRFGERSMLE